MGQVSLHAGHLRLDHETVNRYFNGVNTAFAVFLPRNGILLLAPDPARAMRKVHQGARPYIMKARNLRGDKTIALHDVCIDHNIPENCPVQDMQYLEKIMSLKITLQYNGSTQQRGEPIRSATVQ